MNLIFHIKYIDEVKDNFDEIGQIYPGCFSDKINFEMAKSFNNDDDTYIMFGQINNEYVFMCILKIKHKTVFISDVCVKKEWRGKGILESAFKYIGEYYGKKGKYYLTLTASNNNDNNLNQKKRIKIFNKQGFYISPHNVEENTLPIRVSLTNGKMVNIKSGPLKKEGSISKYLVSDENGNTFRIKMNEIEACFIKSWFSDKKIDCPMKKTLKGGFRRSINNRNTWKLRVK
jgi:hypothetical protein